MNSRSIVPVEQMLAAKKQLAVGAKKEAGRFRRQAFEKPARREGTRRAGGLHRPRALRAVAGRLETSHRHVHLRQRPHERGTRRNHPAIHAPLDANPGVTRKKSRLHLHPLFSISVPRHSRWKGLSLSVPSAKSVVQFFWVAAAGLESRLQSGADGTSHPSGGRVHTDQTACHESGSGHPPIHPTTA
jgi:hypothetical protein